MTVSLKHAFESEVADGDDDTLIRPSNWNAEHVITMATDRVLGRTTAEAGAVEELDATAVRTLINVEDGADVTDATNVAAAGAVMEADYDANTILAANSANTPAPLTIAEQRLVGRITAGNIAALEPSQVRTLINVEDGADVTDATNVAAAGAVMASLFDANTILAANTDNTPAAVTVAEARLVGRSTGGNIAALDAAASRTILGLATGDSPQFTGIELSHASANTLTASSGILSIEGTPLLKAGRETLVIPASAWCPTITNGAGRSYAELATNDLISETIDFDTTTQEFATFEWYPPQKWNAGTITFRVRWRSAAGDTADTLDMALSAVAVSNDDAEDAAPGTPVVVTDTWIANGDLHISPESSAVTIAGTPAKADKVFLKLQRDVSTDDLAGDALIEAVEIFYTTDAATDA